MASLDALILSFFIKPPTKPVVIIGSKHIMKEWKPEHHDGKAAIRSRWHRVTGAN